MCSILWTICLTSMERFTNFKDTLFHFMKKSLLFKILLILLPVVPLSCKKYIEQQQQNALVAIVTKGQWQVTGYKDHQTDITDSFSLYAFQFNADGTVYGVKYGQQTNGTWTADVGHKTITSNFPSAGFPISMLNHTWTITDSYTDSVAAKTSVDSSVNILNIRKIQ
jgi:hypothetical protein